MGKSKKEINVKDLKWKKVDIGDALDDFNGFYGLEEIEGVDVKIINGQAHFYSKDEEIDLNRIGNYDSDEDEDEDDNENDNDEGYSEGELIEFKNFDDIKEGELSAVSTDDEQEKEDKDGMNDEASADESEYESANDELTTNVFTSNIDLNDIDIELPEWTKIDSSLSMTISQGLSRLEFSKPTRIQAKAIPYALKGEDIMGKASTGSGKTLAYGIPILENLIKSLKENDFTSCIGIIFTPTRELAQQVTRHLQRVSEQILISDNKYAILSLTGGLSIQKQERLLNYKCSGRIIVATPGRFLELLEKNDKLINRFCETKTLVLDEADRLLQDGHFDEFERILKLLRQRRQKKYGRKSYWQTMIFSATFSMDLFSKLSSNQSLNKFKNNKNSKNDDELEFVLRHLMNKIHFKSKPIIIDTNPEDKVSSQIKESLIECAPLERDLYVYYFLMMYPGQTLIFCNAIDSVKKLNSFLNFLKVSSFQIHSSMTQKSRLKNLERYQKQAHHNNVLGKPTVLIASDVAARGLDIPGIQHVIHYHLPHTADVYIHRSGRTARGSNEGVSVMICSPQEAMGPLRKLRKLLSNDKKIVKNKKWQKTVPLMPIEVDVVNQLRERHELATQLADHDIASTSLHKDDNWLKKVADDLEIDVDSDDEIRDVFLAKNKTKKLNKTMSKEEVKYAKARLNELLNEPIRKDRRKKYLTGGLVNLADDLVKKRGHDSIVGHHKVDALEVLKKKKPKI